MPGPHDKIIADAARAALGPLDFRRKGRSRTWLADHGWWLAVVEFQPSSWSKGSYLNVAAHWLWSDSGHLSFDYGGRVEGFKEYASDEQFASAAHELAMAAAHEARRLADAIVSLSAAAEFLLTYEASMPGPGKGSWSAYNAGVAAGLAGRQREAEGMFRSVTDERVKAAADHLIEDLSEQPRFKRAVASLVAKQRSALGLEELSGPPF